MGQEELRKVLIGRISGIQKRLADCTGALEGLKMTIGELETAELEEVKPEVGPQVPEEPVEEPEEEPEADPAEQKTA